MQGAWVEAPAPRAADARRPGIAERIGAQSERPFLPLAGAGGCSSTSDNEVFAMMTRTNRHESWWSTLLVAIALILAAAGVSAQQTQELTLKLSGEAEVPPAKTSASGIGTIIIGPERAISGMITTNGMKPTMAHIHEGAEGANGPIAIPLVRDPEGNWSIPDRTKLTEAQHEALMAGRLYVNVHSNEFPGGEVRAQLKPGQMKP